MSEIKIQTFRELSASDLSPTSEVLFASFLWDRHVRLPITCHMCGKLRKQEEVPGYLEIRSPPEQAGSDGTRVSLAWHESWAGSCRSLSCRAGLPPGYAAPGAAAVPRASSSHPTAAAGD